MRDVIRADGSLLLRATTYHVEIWRCFIIIYYVIPKDLGLMHTEIELVYKHTFFKALIIWLTRKKYIIVNPSRSFITQICQWGMENNKWHAHKRTSSRD